MPTDVWTFKILVGTRHVEASEKWQIIFDNGERHQQYGHQHGVVSPVGGVSLGGVGHVGDCAEHGGIDADARCPPGYAAAALEKVVGIALAALHKVIAQQHHAHEIGHEHRPVEPPNGGPHVPSDSSHGCRPDARLALAVHHHPFAVACHKGCPGACQQRRAAFGHPRVGDGVVYNEFVVESVPNLGLAHVGGLFELEPCHIGVHGLCAIPLGVEPCLLDEQGAVDGRLKALFVHTARKHYVGTARGHTCGTGQGDGLGAAVWHNGGHTCPLVCGGVVTPPVGVCHAPLGIGGRGKSARQVKARPRGAVLHHAHGLHTRGTGQVGQALPLLAAGETQSVGSL